MLLVLIEGLVLQKVAKGKKAAAPAENGDAKTEVCTYTWIHVY